MSRISAVTLILVLVLAFSFSAGFGAECCAAKAAKKCSIDKPECLPGDKKAVPVGQAETQKGVDSCLSVTFSIMGLKSSDSKEAVSKLLTDAGGVICVRSIDLEKGETTVCYNPQKTEPAKLLKAISAGGYEAVIAPSVTCEKAGHADKSGKCAVTCKRGMKSEGE
jgi:hypothetical protein